MSNAFAGGRWAAGGLGRREGKRLYWVWWLVGCVAVLAGALPWLWRHIHWRAVAVVTAGFVTVMFVTETLALHWEWWIWTEALLLGPKVGLIPLEEFLLYFCIVPVLAVMHVGVLWVCDALGGGRPR